MMLRGREFPLVTIKISYLVRLSKKLGRSLKQSYISFLFALYMSHDTFFRRPQKMWSGNETKEEEGEEGVQDLTS